MLFHDFLEALLRSWGHEPKGTTVWQLLKEVLQNLPFGTKTEEGQEVVTPMAYKFMPEGYPKVEMEMVEIVPEQSVTTVIPDGLGFRRNIPMSITNEETGKVPNIRVNINGKEYECSARQVGEIGDEWVEFGDVWDDQNAPPPFTEYPFIVQFYQSEEFDGCAELSIYWSIDLGETITLAIYEEQEVVTPLDPKFRGFGEITVRENILAFTATATASEKNIVRKGCYLAENVDEPGQYFPDESQTLKIFFDGVPYNANRQVYNYAGISYGYGNFSLVDIGAELEDTGEPFCWVYYGTNSYLITKKAGTHTLSVDVEYPGVKQIDIKYLPIDELKQALGIGGEE